MLVIFYYTFQALKQNVIKRQIISALEKIKIDEKQKNWIQSILSESYKEEQKYTKKRLNSLLKQKEFLSKRIETIYLDKLDGKISEEFWAKKHDEWTYSLLKIQNMVQAYKKTNMNFINMSEEFLKICSEISELFLINFNSDKI